MKKLLLFSFVTVATLYAGGKLVEPPTVPPVPVVVDEWSGPYVGLQAGYVKGKGTINLTETYKNNQINAVYPTVINNYDPFTLKPSGFIGGIFAGVNRKLDNRDVVLGIEAVLNYTNIKKTKSPLSVSGDDLNGQSYTLKQKWDVALYGRVGMLMGEDKSLMPYLLAGMAGCKLYGGMTKNGVTKWDKDTLTGWTVGAGLEYKINKNWHVRAQYRYTDYGSATFTHDFSSGMISDKYTAKVKKYKTHSVMVGLSYHFK